WAQSEYARLALAISTGRNLETPGIVTRRYVTRGMPGSLPLTVSSPTNGSSVTGSTVTATGPTTPGASFVAEAVGDVGGAAAIATGTFTSPGHWSLSLPVGFGATTITVTSTLGRRTGYTQLTVADIPGTRVLDVSDPTGDDTGPGTYQYPTSSNFTAGSFDLTRMLVSQDGTNVYIQV